MMEFQPPSRGGPIMACAVCARVLDAQTDGGRLVGYRHPDHFTAADHVAVPVPQAQVHVEGVCDFCGDPGPDWVVPARTFAYIARAFDDDGTEVDVDGGLVRNQVGNWAACARCAGYVTRGQWDTLARYSVRRSHQRREMDPEPARDEFMIRSLVEYWQLLRDNMTGPPRPATPEDWR